MTFAISSERTCTWPIASEFPNSFDFDRETRQFRLVPIGRIGTLCPSSRDRSRTHVSISGKRGATRSRVKASVAQLVEQLICNQPVAGSNPSAGSKKPRQNRRREHEHLDLGGLPEWLKGADCKSASFAYTGSNPVAPMEEVTGFRHQVSGNCTCDLMPDSCCFLPPRV